MRKIPSIIWAVIVVLLIAGGLFAVISLSDSAQTKSQPIAERTISEISAVDIAEGIAQPSNMPPEGYVQYTNEQYGFSFYHSPQAGIKEYDEGGGAMTVVLENEKTVRGLQIFIVPYDEPTISEERFLMDVPSGVRENVEPTRVGVKQIEAVTFNSEDPFLGETREVWFIHNGHLYEVTTFSGLRDWFVPIMQSWRFLGS